MEFEFVDWQQWGADAFSVSPYRAVHGTESMPTAPLDCAADCHVPLMTGTVRNEATGFLAALGLFPDVPTIVADQMLALMGADEPVQQSYRTGPRHLTTNLELAEAVWTDWTFRIPTLQLVELLGAPAHVYEFHWQSPAFPPGLGANHALEMPFMRDDLAAMRAVGPAGEALLGPDAPQELATTMHRTFVDYAVSGDPGWPAYDAVVRPTMVFDAASGLQNDPAATERQAWVGRR
jgi:carboxylesterase type B